MLTLFFWLFSQRISTASLAITQTKRNNLFKYWWKSTSVCSPAVRSGARWVSQVTPHTKDKDSHFGLWEQLVSLGITPFREGPYHTFCPAVTQEAVVNFSFLLGNINFPCATAEGTSHRSDCGSPPSPGVTTMAFRLFPRPALGGFWECRDLKRHDPYMLPERGTLLMRCGFSVVLYSEELWLQALVVSCSDYGAEPPLWEEVATWDNQTLVTPPQPWGTWSWNLGVLCLPKLDLRPWSSFSHKDEAVLLRWIIP